MNDYGMCVCDSFWYGEECDKFGGYCSPICEAKHGCKGPHESDCIECVENASRDAYGNCVCDPYWSGPDCSTFAGSCHPSCGSCRGPGYHDCILCCPNSYMGDDHDCHCNSGWSGDHCDMHQSACSPTCDRCNMYGQCIQCIARA
jgi:hypothetical protein